MPDGPQLLIVEDDVDIRDTLDQILSDEGYQIRCAANGQEALDLLRRDGAARPSLILLDLMMPVMNGWTFQAEKRADPRLADIPVVVISADPSVEQKAAAVEAVAFLRKPLQLEELLTTVARIVDGQ